MTILYHASTYEDARYNVPSIYFITPLGKENEPYCPKSHLGDMGSRKTRKMGIYLQDMGPKYAFNDSMNRDLFQMVDYVLAPS